MADIKELMSADDDDLSKINTEGITEEQIIDRLNRTAIVWVDVEPKYKQCEKEFKFIKKWMIDNNKKILSCPLGSVGIKTTKINRLIQADIPDVIKDKYRKEVTSVQLRKLF
jgi:hypothetical protein